MVNNWTSIKKKWTTTMLYFLCQIIEQIKTYGIYADWNADPVRVKLINGIPVGRGVNWAGAPGIMSYN